MQINFKGSVFEEVILVNVKCHVMKVEFITEQ